MAPLVFCGGQAQLENARRDGLSPNLINYNCCVDVCAKTGEVDRALALLEQMQTSGDPALMPDIVTCVQAVSGRESGGGGGDVLVIVHAIDVEQ